MKIALIAITCASLTAIDGDTALCDGTRYRLLGFDAPETRRPAPPCERKWGLRAKRRLTELLETGWPELVPSGRKGRWGRPLAWLLVDGKDVGQTLIKEKLARPYRGGKRKRWC